MSYDVPSYILKLNKMQIPYKALVDALEIIKECIGYAIEDEYLCNTLLALAPTEAEKDIMMKIINDEKKHRIFFREIYEFYSGENLTTPKYNKFYKTNLYIPGIKKALFRELEAINSYTIIRAGIPHKFFKDIICEAITDKFNHAHKYNSILYLNFENTLMYNCNAHEITPS